MTAPSVAIPDLATAVPSGTDREGTISSRSFLALVATQFLGALNDNLFRWLAVPIGQKAPELGSTGALVLGGICFTVPYLLLAPAAGSLADRFSKRSVIVGCKVAEIVLMLLGTAAILLGHLPLLFTVVTLMGAQSALFAPAKFGSLPEMLRPDQLSNGNGIMGLATVVAAALGTIGGFWLFGVIEPPGGVPAHSPRAIGDVWPAMLALVGVASGGTLLSLLIRPLPIANPHRRMEWNPITKTVPALRLLFSDVRLARTALGIAFFWFLASLAQLNIDPFGEEILGLPKAEIGVLMAVLVAGLGCGSVLAGYWSDGKVELGIVPLGAMGIIAGALWTFVASAGVNNSLAALEQGAFFASCLGLFLLGVSAGLFDIPLEAYLQYQSSDETRGTILAGSNFLTFVGILLSCGLFYLLHRGLGLSSAEIFMAAGLLTIPVAVYVFRLLPAAFVRFVMWLGTHTLYRVRIIGRENLPAKGGALIVSNHVTYVDGLILLSSSSRMVRFVVYADFAEMPVLHWLGKTMRVIPIKAEAGPRALVQSLQTARQALLDGELVCIFPEGALTRSGQLQSFNRGMLKILEGTGAPVIPVFLHGLWGSIFSFEGGKYFWKLPRKLPYPVTVLFGKPITAPRSVFEVRQAVEELGSEAELMNNSRRLIPVRQFLRQCRRNRSCVKMADSSGLELTAQRTLIAALALRRVLLREILAPHEQTVGVLLPPSVGGALANLALALCGRTSVNLNYTLSDELLNHCVQQADIRHVLTSRKFLEKKPVTLQGAEFVCLEDLKPRISALDKALAALGGVVVPVWLLERLLGLTRIDPDDLLTIIFTSGSTGEPKGVMLSQANIASNLVAVDQILNLKPNDCLLGVLPFFHSFGYTVCLWLVHCFDGKAVYHFNPLDAKTVGALAEQHGMTILLATPTFLKMYLKRCTPEQFSRLDLVVVGAEKLPQDLARQFEEKFGVFPMEGYGTTELSPVVSCNIPPHRSGSPTQIGHKPGTVGRPIPGVSARVVDPDTWENLGADAEGLLLIKGPNVMKGYLHQPEKTAAVIRDGWYVTGDMAKIDPDGFIHITGRLSRFSKIGGEMVPHIRIEEELARILEGDFDPDDPQLKVAVTAVPDPDKGERLVVLHLPLKRPVEEVLKELQNVGLPNLWLPDVESFVEVERIPVLGSGKLDLRTLQQLARERFPQASAVSAR
jgi:acyl-[acyl-carrier-protein]-phospholipid O-acyltransferase/long-chain-fatty-acid--[acyl-carrier-protein] ligase